MPQKEENLDECNKPECQNVNHPSCFNKLLVAFAEDEWEGLKLLEQEWTIKMEKLRTEAVREHLKVEKERLQLKVDLLWQKAQLLKEGVSQDDIDSALPLVND